jgi:microsomal dipeptidase-like Zn-dependent dipeptidase
MAAASHTTPGSAGSADRQCDEQCRIAVDIAHAGVCTLEAIKYSTQPVICSHANARALCEHPRNLPDEVIKAVAGSSGVIGLCAFPASFHADLPVPVQWRPQRTEEA